MLGTEKYKANYSLLRTYHVLIIPSCNQHKNNGGYLFSNIYSFRSNLSCFVQQFMAVRTVLKVKLCLHYRSFESHLTTHVSREPFFCCFIAFFLDCKYSDSIASCSCCCLNFLVDNIEENIDNFNFSRQLCSITRYFDRNIF